MTTAIAPAKPRRRPQPPPSASALAQRVSALHVDRIHPHPLNPRHDLGDLRDTAASIRTHGLLEPLVVQPHPDEPRNYQLICGHRRLEAAKMARVEVLPCIVRHGLSDDIVLEMMLVENCHRATLNPMDQAEALGRLIDRGYSQTKIAKRTGMSESWVSYNLALLELDLESRQRVRRGDLSAGDAVNAVRRARRAKAKKQGGTADYTWEPDYLTANHPLAKKARKLCDARDHTMRRRIGKTACGQCWETVIREDERIVGQAATP